MLQKSIMDTKPELKWLKLDELYIPVKYQRAIEGGHSLRIIDHIQHNFSWGEFGTLLVSKLKKDNSKYAVIDGQHRLRGVELRDDIDQVPCVVISPREIKEQAQTFININSNRTPLNSFQLHRALLVAHDPHAIELERICKEADCIIPTYVTLNFKTPPEVFQGPGIIRRMIAEEVYQSDDIIWALKVIRNAYPKKNGALRLPLIQALINFVIAHPGTNRTEMSKTLRTTYELSELSHQADILRRAQGSSLWKNYLILIEKMYKNQEKKAA